MTKVRTPTPRSRRPDSPRWKDRAATWSRRAARLAALLALPCVCRAESPAAPRSPGQILVVRGALTVFSLGLNDLGDDLRNAGLDVNVEFAALSPLAANSIKSTYRQNRHPGPVVIIGHSLGAYLAPSLARQLQGGGAPVDLMVILDCVHDTTIPPNVRRCINLYQSAKHGVIKGLPVRAESPTTVLRNIEVNKYQEQLGKAPPEVLAAAQFRHFDVNERIDHFNIDKSDWIHEIVIREVMDVCSPKSDKR